MDSGFVDVGPRWRGRWLHVLARRDTCRSPFGLELNASRGGQRSVARLLHSQAKSEKWSTERREGQKGNHIAETVIKAGRVEGRIEEVVMMQVSQN